MIRTIIISLLITVSFICTLSAQDKSSIEKQLQNYQSEFIAFYQKGDFPNAQKVVEKGLAYAKKHKVTQKDMPYFQQWMNNAAVIAAQSGALDLSFDLFKARYDFIVASGDTRSETYIRTASYLANVLSAKGKLGDAALFLEQILEQRETYTEEEQSRFTPLLASLGTTYIQQNKFEAAEALLLEALAEEAQQNSDRSPYYMVLQNNLAIIYQRSRQYDKAQKIVKELEVKRKEVLGENHPDYAHTLEIIAAIAQEKKDTLEAVKYTRKAFELRKSLGENHRLYAMSLLNVGQISYSLEGKKEQGKNQIFKARNIIVQTDGVQSVMHAKALSKICEIYAEEGKYDKAIETIREAILCLSDQYENKINSDLEFVDWLSLNYIDNELVLTLMYRKVEVIYNKSKDLNDPEAKKKAFQTAQMAHALGMKLKNQFTFEGDKLRQLEALSRITALGIKIANELYQTTHEIEYKNAMFDLIESNKAVLLWEETQSKQAVRFGDVSDEVIKQEQDLRNQVAETKMKILNERDSVVKRKYQLDLNEQNQKLNDFKEGIKKEYPKFYALNYDIFKSVKSEVQQVLDPHQALLSYYVTDTLLYISILAKEVHVIHSFSNDLGDLKEAVGALRLELTSYDHIKNSPKAAYQKFSLEAKALFDKLLAPVWTALQDYSHLIIEPDHLLGAVPFEVLLTSSASNDGNFSALPYLIKSKKISYTYAANLLLENNRKQVKKGLSILGIAPGYGSQNLKNPIQRSFRQELLRKNLEELAAAQAEVGFLANYWPEGQYWYGPQAHEKVFKDSAQYFSIIHFAMHGLVNEENPILSSLVFTETGDSTEDNFLHAYEVASLDLQAELVVLSACETGYGKFQRGEGVMSIARSFMYAGVPSLVVSLWQVNDNTTAKIMEYFYKELGAGKDKAAALRQAKLRYLDEVGDHIAAHPAFWAPFIQLGDSRALPLQRQSNWWGWALLAGSVLLLGGGLLLRSKKRAS